MLLSGSGVSLSSTGAGGGLDNLRHLSTRADDPVALIILDDFALLVLGVGLFPDLDLATAADNTDSHGGEQVVGSVRVVVDTTVEHGSGVLAETALDHGLATRVILDEVGDIVNDTSDSNETAAILGLLDVVIPLHDGELLKRGTPIKSGASAIELLLKLLNATLLNLVGAELLEVVGESDLLPHPDGPLGGVVLVPLNGISVIRWELVVEVVVTFSEGNESGNDVVTRRVAVVKGLVTEPVSKGVDAESGLLDEENAEDAGIDETTTVVTPAEASDESGEDQTHKGDDREVVLVLPDDNGVIIEVGDVSAADSLWVLLHEHPAKVRVEETLADRVRILVGVGVAVVSAVIARPPSDGTLDGTSANSGEEDLKGERGRVRRVRP